MKSLARCLAVDRLGRVFGPLLLQYVVLNLEHNGQEDYREHRVGEDHVQVDLWVLFDEQAYDERNDELTLCVRMRREKEIN